MESTKKIIIKGLDGSDQEFDINATDSDKLGGQPPEYYAKQSDLNALSWLDDTGELPGAVPTITGTKYNCRYELSSTSMLFYNPNYMPTDLDITGYCFLDTNGTEYTITEGSYNSGPPGYIITGVSPSLPTTSVLTSSGKIVLYKKGSLKWCNPANKTASVVVGTTNSSCKPYTEQEVDFLCTGTNDQDVIKDAIDYVTNWCVGNPGGKIVLLEGEYYIDEQISIVASYVTIEGMGSSTKIYNNTNLTENYVVRLPNSKELTIRNCHFIHNDNANVISFLQIGWPSNPTDYCTIENNIFTIASGHAIAIENGKYTKITGNTFTTNDYGDGIYTNGTAYNAIIANNTFTKLLYGINIAGTSPGVTISGNSFYDVDRCMYLSCVNSSIVGNCLVGMTTRSIDLQSSSNSNLVVGNNMIGMNITDSGTNNTKTANKY